LKKKAYTVTEILFESSTKSKNENGINCCLKTIFEKVSNLPKICENIIISGGTSLLKGFPERIKNELHKTLQNQTFKINACDGRCYNVFTGASVLSSLNYFNEFQLKQETYNDSGPEQSILKLHPVIESWNR